MARVAVWASALTLTASAVKDWCYQAADRAVSDIETHMKGFGDGDDNDEEGGDEENGVGGKDGGGGKGVESGEEDKDEEAEHDEFLEAYPLDQEVGGSGYGTPSGEDGQSPTTAAGKDAFGASFADTH